VNECLRRLCRDRVEAGKGGNRQGGAGVGKKKRRGAMTLQ